MGSSCSCVDATSDFEEIHNCMANGLIPVTKYISKSTGLTVVHADIEGPIVSGYICVPTRASDDDGMPHALEHLIFFGSTGYPYSGVLDRLANKCLSSGTNAWTDVDHTCFTLSTAGSDGFCQLLPIFMDHILFPLLTDAAFRTEVYHVGGRGNDGGIIYSEIMALENTSYSRASDVLFKELYPPNSGYRYNVGGALNNLRESANNKRVKAFHKAYYHPQNVCLIVCGKIDPKSIFRSLYPVMKKASNASLAEGSENTDTGSAKIDRIVVKPWLTEENGNIPDVPLEIHKSILFPSVDEEGGCLVTVGMLGSSIINTDITESYALTLLFKYLTKGAAAPLQLEFVEKDTGFLATSLDFNVVEYSRTAYIFEFDGVDAHDAINIASNLRKVLEVQLSKFDISRMEDIIKSSILGELTQLENAPHGFIAEAVIRDFIYGDNDYSKFEKRLNRISSFEFLLHEPVSFWTNLLQEKILLSNWVVVSAEPYKNLLKELAQKDEERVYQRNQVLGANGLSIFMHELDEAILHNNREIPSTLLKKVKVPSMKSIQYHQINRIKNPAWVPRTSFPTTLCLDDISTNFVYVGLLMDTSNLEDKYRKFLPLFKEVLLTSPMHGAANISWSHCDLIPYEEVCAMRERVLQVCELAIGIELDFRGEGASRFSCGSYSHVLALDFQMEMQKVEEGFNFIKKILWETYWSTDRIKIALNKLIEDVHHLRRDGRRVCQMILKHLIYKENSNVVNCSFITQYDVLKDMGVEDESTLHKNEKAIKHAFDCILNVIRDPENISLHIATRISTLKSHLEKCECKDLGTLLKMSFPFPEGYEKPKGSMEFASMPDVNWMKALESRRRSKFKGKNSVSLLDLDSEKSSQVIFASDIEEYCHMAMVGPGPSSYADKDLPALLTTLQYFTQQEGPLYQKIRGEGYAYSYNVVTKINEGLVYFHLYRCADIVGAYSACLSVIMDHLTKKSKELWKKDLLEAAKSSLIFQCLDTEKTPLSLAATSMMDYFRNVSGDYIRDLIMRISKVKIKDVKKMTKKYLDYTSRSSYATVVVCPEERADIIRRGMSKLGKGMRVINNFGDL